VAVIEQCDRYNIPIFLVRSKADLQIQNILQDFESKETTVEVYERARSAARQLLIYLTKKNLDENLQKANLAKREVFIISSSSLRALMTGNQGAANMIDEGKLLQAVLKVYTRRFGAQAQLSTLTAVK
jgi:ABC-type hemin transport system substrate-binding protein